MDYFKMNANTQIERRLRGIENDLQDVAIQGRMISMELSPLEHEVGFSKNHLGSSDESSWQKRFEEIQVNRTIFQLKSLIALEKISNIVTEVRDNAPTIWLVNTPLTGELLWFYVVWTLNFIVGAWYYGESAKFCDVVVTRAFMAGELHSTRFPWICLVDKDQTVLDNNKSELVYYIARQAVAADRGARISFWASVFFVLSIIYSVYRSSKEREFRKTQAGKAGISAEAKELLSKWLTEHGHPSPAYLNSRYSQVEYLLESAKFKGKDARTELEYDEVSGSGSEYESDEEYNGTSEHETSPEPVNSVDSP